MCRGYIEEDDLFLSVFLLGANESNAEVTHSPEPFAQHADDHSQSEPEDNEFHYGSAGPVCLGLAPITEKPK